MIRGSKIIGLSVSLLILVLLGLSSASIIVQALENNFKTSRLASNLVLGGCTGQECTSSIDYGYSELYYRGLIIYEKYAYVIAQHYNYNISIIKYNLSEIYPPSDPPPGIIGYQWDVQENQVISTGGIEINLTGEGAYYCGNIWSFNATHLALACLSKNVYTTGWPIGQLILLLDVSDDKPQLVKVLNITSNDPSLTDIPTANNIVLLNDSTIILLLSYSKDWIEIVKLDLNNDNVVWSTPLFDSNHLPTGIRDIYPDVSKMRVLANGSILVLLKMRDQNNYVMTGVLTISSEGDITRAKIVNATMEVWINNIGLIDSDASIYLYKNRTFIKLSPSLNVLWGLKIPMYYTKSSSGESRVYGSLWSVSKMAGDNVLLLTYSEYPLFQLIVAVDSQTGTPIGGYITSYAYNYGENNQYGMFSLLGGSSNYKYIFVLPSVVRTWPPPFTTTDNIVYEISNIPVEVLDMDNVGDSVSEIPIKVEVGNIYGYKQYEWNEVRYDKLTHNKRIYLYEYPPPSLPALEQNPSEGVYRYGTYFDEALKTILRDDQGNTYLFAKTFRDDAFTSTPNYYMLILKLDPSGEIISNRIVYVGVGTIRDAVFGNDGYIYVLVSEYSIPYYSRNSYLIKIDPQSLDIIWGMRFDDGYVDIVPRPNSNILYLIGAEKFSCYGSNCYPSPNTNATLTVVDVGSNPPTVITKRIYYVGYNGERHQGAFMPVGGVFIPPSTLYMTVLFNLSTGFGGIYTMIFQIDTNTYQFIALSTMTYKTNSDPSKINIPFPLRTLPLSNGILIIGANILYDINKNEKVDTDAAVMVVPYNLNGRVWCKLWGPDPSGNYYDDSFIDASYIQSQNAVYMLGYTSRPTQDYYGWAPAFFKVSATNGSLQWEKIFIAAIYSTDILSEIDHLWIAGYKKGTGNENYEWLQDVSAFTDCDGGSTPDSSRDKFTEAKTLSPQIIEQPLSYIVEETFLTMGNYDPILVSLNPEGDPMPFQQPTPIPEPPYVPGILVIVVAITIILLFYSKKFLIINI